MAQGQIKRKKTSGPKITQRKQTGSRVIKPKKTLPAKQHEMKKKHSAGLTAMTEKSLAEKAGHLELLRGGKKEGKAKGKGKGPAGEVKAMLKGK